MTGEAERATYREMRLALVFNGGVSLAVWMGGAAIEIDRFRSAFYRPDAAALAPYRRLLDAVRTEAVTDVIAGTSAGGINGAMLGFVVANGRTLEKAGAANPIKEIWQGLASIEKLLTSTAPRSALDGLFLFRGCAAAFDALGGTTALPAKAPTRVRLTVTATDAGGYEVKQDGVTARDHRLELRFRNVPRPAGGAILLKPPLRDAIARAVPEEEAQAGTAWPFPESATSRNLRCRHAANLLTRAARSTASFPIAFAPSELPLDHETSAIDGDMTGLTATPPMQEVVSARGVSLDNTHQRYAIDGGVWDNAPFAAVLRDIDRSPARREVDRRLVYVIYTDEELPGQPQDSEGSPCPPKLVDSFAHALTTPSNVAFADDLERIRADMAQQKARRRSFAWLLADGDPDVFMLAPQLLGLYRRRVGQEQYANRIPDTIPDREAPLADWHATPKDWRWDLRPVQVSVEVGRRLLGQLLGGLPADAPGRQDAVKKLTDAREELSQLAWALSDLQDRRAHRRLTEPEREVCGWAMAQFAEAVAGLTAVVAGLPPSPGSDPADDPVKIASALTGGGPETVIKRAIATEISMHAMTSDDRHHRVDYRFDTIRPDVSWPLPIDDGGPRPPFGDKRPPLAGTRYKHFGGFLRTSWRLSDWMWGRLDASSRIVDMLLDVEQLRRLSAGGPQARRELAAQFAEMAIPTHEKMSSARTLRLAYVAFAAHKMLDEPDAPPDPRSNPGDAAAAVETWRARLAEVYETAIDRILASPPPPPAKSAPLVPPAIPDELVRLRADLRRAIQYAIVDDERQGLVEAIVQERDDPRMHVDGEVLNPLADVEVLASRLDGGLSDIVNALSDKLPTLMLARYAETAAANTLKALDKPFLANPVRALSTATRIAQAIKHAKDAVAQYIVHRHGRSAD